MRDRAAMEDVLSRKAKLQRERAMSTARCPKDSKFGECLLNMNTKPDLQLNKNLSRIHSDIRRMEAKLKQLQHTFVRGSQYLNHEPLIIMERTPTSESIRRKEYIETHGIDPHLLSLPGYMYPMKSRSRTPNTNRTIDAFVVKPKRTRNIWEQPMSEKETPSFQSTVRPCSRLTQKELSNLQHTWFNQKTKFAEGRQSPKSRSPQRDHDTPFITQMSRADILKTPDGRLKVGRDADDNKFDFVKQSNKTIKINVTPLYLT